MNAGLLMVEWNDFWDLVRNEMDRGARGFLLGHNRVNWLYNHKEINNMLKYSRVIFFKDSINFKVLPAHHLPDLILRN